MDVTNTINEVKKGSKWYPAGRGMQGRGMGRMQPPPPLRPARMQQAPAPISMHIQLQQQQMAMQQQLAKAQAEAQAAQAQALRAQRVHTLLQPPLSSALCLVHDLWTLEPQCRPGVSHSTASRPQ